MSLIVTGVIVAGTWSLFRRSLHLLFDGVPDEIDLGDVRSTLLALSGVRGLHELHVWGLASPQTALTAHLVLDAEHGDGDEVLRAASRVLDDRFGIRHLSLQLESGDCPSDGHC